MTIQPITSPKHLQTMATNFKEEVLKVYPDAVCTRKYGYNERGYKTKVFMFAIHENKTQNKFLSESWFDTSKQAWQNAYNNILNQKQ
jgi:hypothetical protein